MQSDYRFKPAAIAAQRVRHGDKQGASWTFFRVMSQQDRDDFDAALTAAKHPLAFRAGSQEWRFNQYVAELLTISPPLG